MALPATQLKPKTYEDLLAIPDDGKRYELFAGEILMSPAPILKHQYALLQLAEMMNRFVRDGKLGRVVAAPYDVRFSAHYVVQPDLLFVRRERARLATKHYFDGAPDLVVEILSPSNRMYDLVRKSAVYADNGISEYWILDPEDDSITVNALVDGLYVPAVSEDGIARSKVLPGFHVDLSDIFNEPDWLDSSEA